MRPKKVKGTPETKPLTKDDWLDMIEQRRAIIAPHLNRFTLSQLMECFDKRQPTLKVSERYHRAKRAFPNWETPDDPGFNPSTQGIFFGANYKPDGTWCVWGLSRSGQWLLADVSFRKFFPQKGPEPNVCIRKSYPEEIIDVARIGPEVIWYGLASAVKDWIDARQKLLNEAKEVEQKMDREFIHWLIER